MISEKIKIRIQNYFKKYKESNNRVSVTGKNATSLLNDIYDSGLLAYAEITNRDVNRMFSQIVIPHYKDKYKQFKKKNLLPQGVSRGRQMKSVLTSSQFLAMILYGTNIEKTKEGHFICEYSAQGLHNADQIIQGTKNISIGEAFKIITICKLSPEILIDVFYTVIHRGLVSNKMHKFIYKDYETSLEDIDYNEIVQSKVGILEDKQSLIDERY
jgi:hypothetical protein